MFLLCLFLSYVVVRLWEDTTATIRGHEPPRHDYRKRKLDKRAAAGRKVPSGSAGRYFTGLLDDAWDSAHHRRELMRDHRAEKRARRAAARIERDRARWASADEGLEPDTVPNTGFDAVAPQAAAPGTPVDPPAVAASAGANPDNTAPATSGPAASAPPPTTSPPPQPPATGTTTAPAGFHATVPTATASGPPASLPAIGNPRPATPGRDNAPAERFSTAYELAPDATRELAKDLRQRIAAVPYEQVVAADNEAVVLTEQQAAIAERARTGVRTGQQWSTSYEEWMSLPVSTRADLLALIADIPQASMSCSVPGNEDVEAMALLSHRRDGDFDPLEVQRATTDATGASVRELYAKHAAAPAADQASAQAPADPPPTAVDPTPQEDTTPNNVIPFPLPKVSPAPSTGDTSTSVTVATTATPINTNRMELPVTSTEVTGLGSAIAYAGGLADYCQTTFQQISDVVPTGDQAAASCEQAYNDLVNGGVGGQALTDITVVQEQMTSAARQLQAALAAFEASAAAAASLKTELEKDLHVTEAYSVRPDAGNKDFVTAE